MKPAPNEDVRERLAGWLTSPDNPYFARSFANRAWAHYFGVGIVHPVDDFSQANPPTNPRLLDALADDFEQELNAVASDDGEEGLGVGGREGHLEPE